MKLLCEIFDLGQAEMVLFVTICWCPEESVSEYLDHRARMFLRDCRLADTRAGGDIVTERLSTFLNM